MKKIGLIGGMSWESSLEYYRIINEEIRKRLGKFHSAKCILESVDFAEIEKLQHQNDWESLNQLMAEAATNIENAKADVILLCTNTMHLCSENIKSAISIPFIHIAEATGKAIKHLGIKKVLLLGTKFTMEKDFYRETLQKQFDVEVVIPSEHDREIVHQIIYTELVHGIITENSRKTYQNIIQKSLDDNVEGVILGCTEIPLLIKQEHSSIPIFDTTKIHAESVVNFVLQ